MHAEIFIQQGAPMISYIVTMRDSMRCIERKIIASSTMNAMLTAAQIMPEPVGQFTLTCKPMGAEICSAASA
jgi:hypothetical protein